MRIIEAIVTASVIAQGFDPSRHGPNWEARAQAMDRAYDMRERPKVQQHEHIQRLRGMPCVVWDEDEGTWVRIC